MPDYEAEAFTPLGLDTTTPVALNGYSGGAVPATWANELYREYAPELNIVGVAAGGVPVDLGAVARKVDGTLFAGLYVGAFTALTRAYPEVGVDALMNDAGKAALAKAANMCATDVNEPNIVLAKNYCAKGIKVKFAPLFLQDHVLGMLFGAGGAFSYVEDRFDGKAAPSTCQ